MLLLFLLLTLVVGVVVGVVDGCCCHCHYRCCCYYCTFTVLFQTCSKWQIPVKVVENGFRLVVVLNDAGVASGFVFVFVAIDGVVVVVVFYGGGCCCCDCCTLTI